MGCLFLCYIGLGALNLLLCTHHSTDMVKGDKVKLDRVSCDGNDEEKYRDRGSSASGRHKIISEEPDGPAHDHALNADSHQHRSVKLRSGSSSRRPVSFTPSEGGSTVAGADKRASLYSSGGSDVSVPVSPFRDRRRMVGTLSGSHSGERPRVSDT